MGTMKISLPDTLREFVDEQAAKGGYGSSGKYPRDPSAEPGRVRPVAGGSRAGDTRSLGSDARSRVKPCREPRSFAHQAILVEVVNTVMRP